jgi:riboflavin synthase
MFTGIVQGIGRIELREPRGGDIRLTIAVDQFDLSRTALGDSICVQGVCLTVVDLAARSFATDVSRETLTLTTLGELKDLAAVNLEPALRPRCARATPLAAISSPGTSMALPQ